MVRPRPVPLLSAWRFVTVFGTVSLLADFVYEGARSITGPLLASLGATGLVVGVVTGIGEAAALGLRLVSGPLTDRTRRFWAWTIAGYALTVITVPVLGIAGTLWVACALVIAERIGKAVRSPAKDTLLSHAAHVTGRGRGFAVHEALDQIGAVIGPLTVAGVLALTGDDYGPALGILALPGVAALALLVWLRLRVPDPAGYEPETRSISHPAPGRRPAGHSASAARTAAARVLGLLFVHRDHDGRVRHLRGAVVSYGHPRRPARCGCPADLRRSDGRRRRRRTGIRLGLRPHRCENPCRTAVPIRTDTRGGVHRQRRTGRGRRTAVGCGGRHPGIHPARRRRRPGRPAAACHRLRHIRRLAGRGHRRWGSPHRMALRHLDPSADHHGGCHPDRRRRPGRRFDSSQAGTRRHQPQMGQLWTILISVTAAFILVWVILLIALIVSRPAALNATEALRQCGTA